jgi:hypothetical protein
VEGRMIFDRHLNTVPPPIHFDTPGIDSTFRDSINHERIEGKVDLVLTEILLV